MKSLRHLIIAFVVGLIGQVSAEESRNWTQASTGKVISGTLQSKSADNSEAKIKKENSEAVVSLRTKGMTIMADAADQVVTVQFNAQNKQVPMQPCDFTTQITTRDFIDVGWGGATVEVIGTAKTTNRYLVNIRGKDTVTWFAPVPLIRQILFNVREKKKTGESSGAESLSDFSNQATSQHECVLEPRNIHIPTSL